MEQFLERRCNVYIFHGFYSRLKQFILDIYKGNVAHNADHLSAAKIIKIQNVTFGANLLF